MMNNENRLVCAIYTRVSSQGQVEEGFSLEEQERLLIEHAEKQGYIIYDIYTDPGISAKDIAHRPQIQRLINDIKEGRINVVCAWKLSRTFRCLNELTTVMEVMKANNVIFDFKSEGILDLNTNVGQLQCQILGVVAELERHTISDNVYMGMAAAARQGKYLAGTPPFGYDCIHDNSTKRGSQKLVINEKEAQIVKLIFHMFVKENAGYKAIANHLNHQGYVTKTGKAFSIGTISGIVKNPIYTGYVRWGAHRKWNEKRRKGATEPIIAKGEHEPIISEEMFKRAEAIRLARGGKCQRKYDCMNILTGILKCPECGAGMVLSRAGSSGKKITYYGCGAWHNKGTAVCHSNLVLLDSVNAVVLDKIAELCSDELIIRGVLKKLNKARNNRIDGTSMDKQTVQNQLDKTRRDIKNLQHRFEADDSDIDVQEYKRRIKELRANEEIYKKRLTQLQVEIGQYQSEKTYTLEELRVVFANIRPILEKAEVEELRSLMHLMIESITIDPETRNPANITIKFNPILTNYLGIDLEEEAHKASSFSFVNKKELIFTISLQNSNGNESVLGV